MLEGAYTRKLLRALKQHAMLKSAVIWKHANPFTRGVPDFSISIGARTIWVEVKMQKGKLAPIQKFYLERLRKGAMLVVAMNDGRDAWVEDRIVSFDGLVAEIVQRCFDA